MLGPVTLTDQAHWVSLPCPFAAWKHPSGKDSHPSFGVSVADDGTSIYNCFTCKSKGPFADLAEDLAYYTKNDAPAEAVSEYFDQEELGAIIPGWEHRKTIREETQLVLPDPMMQEVFEPAAGHPYLKKRGITDEVVESLDLRVDPDDKGVERILFPLHTLSGEFCGYTGRAVVDVHPKVRDYFGLQKQQVLLGAHLLGSTDYVILVEGPFDFARMFSYGLPAVACLHSGVTKGQAGILKAIGKPVYVVFDNDEAGRSGAKSVVKLLGAHVPLMKVRYPAKRAVKDPDQLTKKEAYAMLSNARLL